MQRFEAAAMSPPTAEAILADPLFPHARLAYVDAVLDLYESNPPLAELMRDAARILTYGIVMSYWGGYRPDERASWLTVSRLKETIGLFDVASDRQVDHVLSRLVDTGFVTLRRPDEDSRLRVILPTPVMIAHDLDWMRAHYLPLAHLYGEAAYAPAIRRDPAFHPRLRAASIALFPHIARNVLSQNTAMTRFLNRAVGILTLMKFVRKLAGRDVPVISYGDLGGAFGVSRTHVRGMFSTAARHGEAQLIARGRFALAPSLLRGFDRLVADGMVVSAIAYQRAAEADGQAPDPAIYAKSSIDRPRA